MLCSTLTDNILKFRFHNTVFAEDPSTKFRKESFLLIKIILKLNSLKCDNLYMTLERNVCIIWKYNVHFSDEYIIPKRIASHQGGNE
ncbi:UNVERIFIED_CONTAM: hypothetical protein NCL1_32393 [Trichonephila clavipes]